MSLKGIWALLKETFTEFSEDKATRLAAALSYYTIFSLAPLLVVVIAIAGLVAGQEAAQERIVGQIEGLTGSPESAKMIQNMIASARNPTSGIIATIIGVVVLLFGATGVFGQLQEALNTIWDVVKKPGGGVMKLLKDRFLSFTMILGIGFLLLVSLVIDATLSVFNEYIANLFPGANLIVQLGNFLISFGVITLLFALIFKILPDVDISWKDVRLGAVFTALLFVIGREAISLYLGTRGISDTYGAAGSIIVLLLWVYYSAMILFFGAEFTQVYARRYGTRLVPEEGAIRLTEEARAEQGIPHREYQEQAAAEAGREGPSTQPIPAGPTAGGRVYPAPAVGHWQAAGRSKTAEESNLLPEAKPSLLAFSALLTTLIGFISGMVVMRGKK